MSVHHEAAHEDLRYLGHHRTDSHMPFGDRFLPQYIPHDIHVNTECNLGHPLSVHGLLGTTLDSITPEQNEMDAILADDIVGRETFFIFIQISLRWVGVGVMMTQPNDVYAASVIE